MTTLEELAGTKWAGMAELWADPLGDVAQKSECTLSVEKSIVRYTWSHEGTVHEGSLAVRDDGADFRDTWHSPEPMACASVPRARAVIAVQGTYGGDWGWRIALCTRAQTDQLVLQMTNIAPWGEEARAVRMTCERG